MLAAGNLTIGLFSQLLLSQNGGIIFTLFKIRAKKNGYIEIGEWRFPNPVDEVGNRTGGDNAEGWLLCVFSLGHMNKHPFAPDREGTDDSPKSNSVNL